MNILDRYPIEHAGGTIRTVIFQITPQYTVPSEQNKNQ